MKKKLITLALAGLSISMSAQKREYYTDKNLTIEQKLDRLLAEMTLEEKVGQMNLLNGFWDVTGPAPVGGSAEEKYEQLRKGWVGSMLTVRGVDQVTEVQKLVVEQTRLGIPLLIGFDVIHGYKTLSPIPLAEAASWDLEAIEKSAEMAAAEAAASGINWTYSPMMDISKDARWGRVMEGAGEDPFLGAKIAVARVKGFQGDNSFASPLRVAATAKHYAGYGFVEAGLDYNVAEISDNVLYNTVLPPFKAAVEAGLRSVMTSFNPVEGVPATASQFLVRDILKTRWGFDGFVVSDWATIREMITWGYSATESDAAKSAAEAGTDVDMEAYVYMPYLVDLVKEGKVDEAIVDDAARRILRVKFELGLFEDPYRFLDKKREKEIVGSQMVQDAVLDMAKKSVVLLKNETELLPLKKSGQHIVILGSLAEDKSSPLGSWRIAAEEESAVSFLEGMSQYKGNKVTYVKGLELTTEKPTFLTNVSYNTTDRSGFEEAKKAAKSADVVIMVLGENAFGSGEGRSYTNLELPGLQQEFLEEIYKVNQNIVLILNNGRPLLINWAAENIPTILEGWHLGTQAGNALAQVVYGDYNPSGKLTMTFPRSLGQIPISYNHFSTGRPIDKDNNIFWSHYADQEKTPLYPFGYGLSYTKFDYAHLKMAKPMFKKGEKVQVSVEVKNTGKYKGKEVVQLYIRDLHASVVRPVKELKGFNLVEFEPGETKTIHFELTDAELGFYNKKGEYIVEPGKFEVYVGTNSQDVLKTEFELN